MKMININSQLGEEVILAVNGYGQPTTKGKICKIEPDFRHYAYNKCNQSITKIWVDITESKNPRYIGGSQQELFDNETGNKLSF